MVSVPYSVEVNDVSLLLAKGYTGPEYQRVLVDQFDALYELGARVGSGDGDPAALVPRRTAVPAASTCARRSSTSAPTRGSG